MLNFTFGVILGFIGCFFFLGYALYRARIFIGATYSNGYIDVIVDKLSGDEVFCYFMDSDTTGHISKKDFLLQFRLKNYTSGYNV